jgi:arylsulfatase A-like enzyme
MNHRHQRAMRQGPWKYLQVDNHEYLFNLEQDARERANLSKRMPERMNEMRQQWMQWSSTVPEIPEDATVSLGFSNADMPQR